MKIILFLALFTVFSLAAELDVNLYSSQSYKPNVFHSIPLILHNGNDFEMDGSGSVRSVEWFATPTVVNFPGNNDATSSGAKTNLGNSNMFKVVGAISAGSDGFAYFNFKANVEGRYAIQVSFTYINSRGKAKTLNGKVRVDIDNNANVREVVSDVAVQKDVEVEASDEDLESFGFKRQSDGTITCSNCAWSAVVGENTYNTFSWSTNTNINFITYSITLTANVYNVINGTSYTYPTGAMYFILRASTGPTTWPITVTMRYKKVGAPGTTYTFAIGNTLSVTCPNGGSSCSSRRSIAERAASVGDSVRELPVEYKVGAVATTLVAVVAAVAAIVVVRRYKKNTVPVAEQL